VRLVGVEVDLEDEFVAGVDWGLHWWSPDML